MNEFEFLILVRWINLKPVIQSEVGQKDKNKCHILMHTYRIQKNGTDEPTFRAGLEMQTENKLDTAGKGEGGMN